VAVQPRGSGQAGGECEPFYPSLPVIHQLFCWHPSIAQSSAWPEPPSATFLYSTSPARGQRRHSAFNYHRQGAAHVRSTMQEVHFRGSWISAGGGREKHCGSATTSTHIMSKPGAWVSWLQHQQLAGSRCSKESWEATTSTCKWRHPTSPVSPYTCEQMLF
jgi:hypothetical protein